ncbi:hypothetical protein QOT17_003664 [Balamuthia mandrillaris]
MEGEGEEEEEAAEEDEDETESFSGRLYRFKRPCAAHCPFRRLWVVDICEEEAVERFTLDHVRHVYALLRLHITDIVKDMVRSTEEEKTASEEGEAEDDEMEEEQQKVSQPNQRARRGWWPPSLPLQAKEQEEVSGESVQGSRSVACVFYQSGHCNKGSNCRYGHFYVQPSSSSSSPSFTPFQQQQSQQQPPACWFFVNGFCNKGTSCPFSHPATAVPTTTATISTNQQKEDQRETATTSSLSLSSSSSSSLTSATFAVKPTKNNNDKREQYIITMPLIGLGHSKRFKELDVRKVMEILLKTIRKWANHDDNSVLRHLDCVRIVTNNPWQRLPVLMDILDMDVTSNELLLMARKDLARRIPTIRSSDIRNVLKELSLHHNKRSSSSSTSSAKNIMRWGREVAELCSFLLLQHFHPSASSSALDLAARLSVLLKDMTPANTGDAVSMVVYSYLQLLRSCGNHASHAAVTSFSAGSPSSSSSSSSSSLSYVEVEPQHEITSTAQDGERIKKRKQKPGGNKLAVVIQPTLNAVDAVTVIMAVIKVAQWTDNFLLGAQPQRHKPRPP